MIPSGIVVFVSVNTSMDKEERKELKKQSYLDDVCCDVYKLRPSDFKCGDDKVFLYSVYNRKSKIVKLGKSTDPVKRIKTHIANFMTYANADLSDLGYIFGRFPFPVEQDPEGVFLKTFKKYAEEPKSVRKNGKCIATEGNKAAVIKNEFFCVKNLDSIRGKTRLFLFQLTQKLFNHETR